MSDLALVVLGALLATPIAFLIGSRHERAVARKQRNYLRRVTGARNVVARPGTSAATVRVAAMNRGAEFTNGSNTSPRK